MAWGEWHVVLAVGNGISGWPELSLGRSRSGVTLLKLYLTNFFLVVQLKLQVCGVTQCSAWPWFLPGVPTAWHSPCGLAVDEVPH